MTKFIAVFLVSILGFCGQGAWGADSPDWRMAYRFTEPTSLDIDSGINTETWFVDKNSARSGKLKWITVMVRRELIMSDTDNTVISRTDRITTIGLNCTVRANGVRVQEYNVSGTDEYYGWTYDEQTKKMGARTYRKTTSMPWDWSGWAKLGTNQGTEIKPFFTYTRNEEPYLKILMGICSTP